MLRLGIKYGEILYYPILYISQRALCNKLNESQSPTIRRVREKIASDKESLKWRKIDVNEDRYIMEAFGNDEQTSDYLVFMQSLTLSPKDWLSKWRRRKENLFRSMQKFIPERHNTLGPDLAASHFIIHRGGAVQFSKSPNWITADENNEVDLPNQYDSTYQIVGIKCDHMRLYYEGLDNIRWLQFLKFLSFHNVQMFDDWYLDRVSSLQIPRLEILDISKTKCTHRGLSCLYRMNTLKQLIVDNRQLSLEYELTYAMLEEALPKLRIVNSISSTSEITHN